MRRRNALEMMSSNNRHLSRADREQLLDGRSDGRAPLDRMVQAARGPATPQELEGLSAALSVFRAGPVGHLATAPTVRRRRVAGVLATGIGLKIMLASLGAAAVGGLTYAAASGGLPNGSHHHNRVTTTSATSTSVTRQGQPSVPGKSTRSTVPSPTAAFNGLCSSWFADAKDPYRATRARFSVLVRAAGGAANVNAYCTGVVRTSHPTHPAHPSNSAPAPAHTTGRPSGVGNTKNPTDHRSGPQNTKTPTHSPHH